jgi:hypothetical protein
MAISSAILKAELTKLIAKCDLSSTTIKEIRKQVWTQRLLWG